MLVAELYRLIEDAKKSDFITPFAKFTAKNAEEGSFEDIPHLKVSLANMMFSFISKLNWKIEDFEFQYNDDPMYAEEQVYTYGNILDELKKMFETDGKPDIANKVAAFKKGLKAPE